MRFLTLILGLAVAMATPLHAASLPKSANFKFDVMRKGKDIGEHRFNFSSSAKAYTVNVSTDIVVKVRLIKLTEYSFQYSSVEIWKNGKLQKLSSTTNDDGTPHALNSGHSASLPASLWNVDIVRSKKLLNTIDGTIMSVRGADLGSEMVPTKSSKVLAHHYRLSAGLARDLWYDANDELEKLREIAECYTVEVNWQDGDIAIIDNTRVMHGHRAIKDQDRRLFIGMGRV